jgi:hypothetical protein
MAEARWQFRNPEEGKRLPLEAITRGLVKTMTEGTSVCVCVRRTVKCSYELCDKCLISPITSPNPSIVLLSRDNILSNYTHSEALHTELLGYWTLSRI